LTEFQNQNTEEEEEEIIAAGGAHVTEKHERETADD
jgi:hypothetical protein